MTFTVGLTFRDGELMLAIWNHPEHPVYLPLESVDSLREFLGRAEQIAETLQPKEETA